MKIASQYEADRFKAQLLLTEVAESATSKSLPVDRKFKESNSQESSMD